MIPCACPKAQFLPVEQEVYQAVRAVLRSGTYILGQEVEKFEAAFSAYLGGAHVVGCGSGTDALVLALRSLDIGRGDEVIVPSHTATATVAAIRMVGAKPVFADVERVFYTIDPEAVERLCSPKTRAIVAVHLYGQPADLDQLLVSAKRAGIFLIEDCAQSTGAEFRHQKLGTIGDVGCFSFFPTKNLGALGDAGAVVCRNPTLAERLRRLRQYGWDRNRVSVEPGLNSRLDEIQAAILSVRLARLDADNAERQRQASIYKQRFQDLPLILPAERENCSHVYHLFVLRTNARDKLAAHLQANGISSGIHYAVPVHRMPAFQSDNTLPVTEAIVREIISLPLYPGLEPASLERVISAVRAFFLPGAANL